MTKAEKILLKDRTEEGFDEYIYDLASRCDAKEFILKKMRKYAEWYAAKTVKQLIGGKLIIYPDDGTMTHTSADGLSGTKTDMVPHE